MVSICIFKAFATVVACVVLIGMHMFMSCSAVSYKMMWHVWMDGNFGHVALRGLTLLFQMRTLFSLKLDNFKFMFPECERSKEKGGNPV
jgi:hypothetical protein